jgi:PilZ domain
MDRKIGEWVRRGPRRCSELNASAEWGDGTCASVVVSEISYTGCRISADQQFVKGETVRLFLPELGQVHAQIRWSRAGIAGAKFLTGDSAKDARRARIGV